MLFLQIPIKNLNALADWLHKLALETLVKMNKR